MIFVWYALIGIFGGVFGGMGMGGGTIIIPLLTLFLSISQKLAQGYNLYAFLIMAVVALIIHSKNKLVHFKDIIIIVISGVLFCIGGSYLTKFIDTTILKYIFAGFLIVLAVIEFITLFRTKNR